MSEEKKRLIERVERMKKLQEEMKKAIPKGPTTGTQTATTKVK